MPVIKGLQKTTLVDYPGKIAATVFTAGCNFRCVFCHNSPLVNQASVESLPAIPEDELIEYLRGRTDQLEGVCISGGEPTLHEDLPAFIRKIKDLGYAVKLDTNGTNPEMLKALIQENLVDYLAMDLKGPIAMYSSITNVEVDTTKILESIDLIKNSEIKHEFRTTMLPFFHQEADIENVGCLLRGAQSYYLQQFRASEGVLDPHYQTAVPYSDAELLGFAHKFKPFITKVKVRGLA